MKMGLCLEVGFLEEEKGFIVLLGYQEFIVQGFFLFISLDVRVNFVFVEALWGFRRCDFQRLIAVRIVLGLRRGGFLEQGFIYFAFLYVVLVGIRILFSGLLFVGESGSSGGLGFSVGFTGFDRWLVFCFDSLVVFFFWVAIWDRILFTLLFEGIGIGMRLGVRSRATWVRGISCRFG